MSSKEALEMAGMVPTEKIAGGQLNSKRMKIIGIAVGILLVIVVTTTLAIVLTGDPSKSTSKRPMTKSGCSSFDKQAVILVSMDGFRADYFERNFSPNIRKLATNGVRAKYMRSQYPTKTFPNHYSIVTGLYPESHGIVSNSFLNENRTDLFKIGGKTSTESKWWKGEPIWITSTKQGVKSATYFWVGSETEIEGRRPDYWYKYNGRVPFAKRVDKVLSWLDMEPSKRPYLITLYFNEPDSQGHRHGPESPQVNKAIKNVDNMIGRLIDGIESRGLSSCVNVILVSDHGMANISCSRTIYLDQLITLNNDINVVGQGASSLLYLKNQANVTKVAKDLKCKHKNLKVFIRGADDTPKRIHYANSKRIGDIILVPDLGWSVLKKNGSCRPGYNGAHGFDNIYPEMRALFVANGPAFKKGLVAPPFTNIEVYNLVAEILKLKPAPNNGSFGSLSYMLKNTSSSYRPNTNSDGKDFSMKCKIQCTLQPQNNCTQFFCPDCNGTITKNMTRYIQRLKLTTKQIEDSIKDKFPWGAPKGGAGKDGCLLAQQSYVTGYSNYFRIPLWVGYKLNAAQANGNSSTTSCYVQDPRLQTNESASCATYNASSMYIKGQLVSPDDFKMNAMEQQDTFLSSNIVPQSRYFTGSQGLWHKTEDLVRKWSLKYGELYVISGSIFDSNGDGFKDQEKDVKRWLNSKVKTVAIPTHFYKIIVRCDKGSSTAGNGLIPECRGILEAMSFIFPHIETPSCKGQNWRENLLQYTASINDIEKLTGSSFFSGLPFPFVSEFKSSLPSSLWDFS